MFGKKDKMIIKIEGMSCAHCAKKVEDTLLSFDEISKAKVNLEKKEAIITLAKELEENNIKEKIEELGYKVISVEKK